MRTLGLLVVVVAGAASAQSARPDACKSDQLKLVADAKHGAFDGMSHSGTALVVKNISGKPCSLSPMITVKFADAKGKELPVKVTTPNPFKGPVPMGHGPVVLPLTVAAGAVVSADMRWVSGAVYDHSVCVEPRTVSLATGEVTLEVDVQAHICGPSESKVAATVSRLK